MNKKIIGILVCMFLIATAVPTVESLKNSTINPTVPSIPPTSMSANWTEKQKLLASDGAAWNLFGTSVSLSGDTALIGAYGNDNDKGSAYVFTRSGTTWTQQQKLQALDGADGDYFGYSVFLSGDTALIGAVYDDDYGNWSGSAYVFTRTGTTWTQQSKLLASDGEAQDYFGYSVSLYGDTALIGAPGYKDLTGSVYVFTRTGTTWKQQAKLLASDSSTWNIFGCSVSLNEDTALIGASWDNDNGNESGSAYVFIRTGTTWSQQQKLLPSDGTTRNWFGCFVSFKEETALIGASGDDSSKGSVYVFIRTGAIWIQQQKLLASDGVANASFGVSVALDGDTAFIGAYHDDDNGVLSGSAYVFTRTGTTWTQQQKLLASDGTTQDNFGMSVAFDGNTVLIGADGDDDNGMVSGSAYVFTRESGTPNLQIDITGGIGVKAVITNNGTANATGVKWQIHVKDGVFRFINKTVNGTIDIPMGETRTVTTGLFLGLGPITIIARANDVEKTVIRIILLFYVLGVA